MGTAPRGAAGGHRTTRDASATPPVPGQDPRRRDRTWLARPPGDRRDAAMDRPAAAVRGLRRIGAELGAKPRSAMDREELIVAGVGEGPGPRRSAGSGCPGCSSRVLGCAGGRLGGSGRVGWGRVACPVEHCDPGGLPGPRRGRGSVIRRAEVATRAGTVISLRRMVAVVAFAI